jgi:hypothetical protein
MHGPTGRRRSTGGSLLVIIPPNILAKPPYALNKYAVFVREERRADLMIRPLDEYRDPPQTTGTTLIFSNFV